MSKPVLILTLLAMLSLTLTVKAQQSTSVSKIRTAETKVLDTGGGCVIRITDPFHGHVAGGAHSGISGRGSYWTDVPPIKTKIDPDEGFHLGFECIDVTPQSMHETIEEEFLGRYDQNKKKWFPYYFSEEDRKLVSDVTRLYNLKTPNADGFARTTDEINGDPITRSRRLTYCLRHGSKAICGYTDVMMLNDPKGNLLPYALKILRSIEFVDPPPTSPSTAQPAPSPAKASTQ